jgi:ATPase subunit of ABC transporter with duplicated ATPase domains
MLSARDLTLRRGPEPLFEQVNFTIFRGNKVGLTGANGAGKSSLFAALRGELGADRGDIDRVLHVENKAIRAYAGNYSQFEQKRARLTRDAASLEARWMEIGTAIEASKGKGANGG